MESLTKQQIVLLTLLVSFVTSIATGIVTVSLMDQAPAGVTQTINRVVEKTIERVVSAPPATQAAAVVTKETVIVKENDLMVAAIEKNLKSLVRINAHSIALGPEISSNGLGVVVTKDGLIVTDSGVLVPGLTYTGTFSDGQIFPLEVVDNREGSRLAFLRILADKTSDKKFVPPLVSFGNSDTLKLGQTVAALGGSENIIASVGTISNLIQKNRVLSDASTTTNKEVPIRYAIEASLSPKDETTGGPLINLSGEVIGIKVNQFQAISFVPINLASGLLAEIASSSAKTASSTNPSR